MEGDQKGLVIAHRHEVWLENAAMKVSEAGRQRVLKERRKNVHAGIEGEWCEEKKDFEGRRVMYDPYRFSSFVYVDDASPCTMASVVKMSYGSVWTHQ